LTQQKMDLEEQLSPTKVAATSGKLSAADAKYTTMVNENF